MKSMKAKSNDVAVVYRREIAILCADKSEMQTVAEKMKTLNAALVQK